MNNLAPVLAESSDANTAFDGFNSGQGSNEPEPTAGALLRNARESAGMHIAALAVTLKVPVRKLEALEQDRFDLLPDAVFARALAASVCRTLKLDVAMVLERLPKTSTPKLSYPTTRSSTPFRSSGYGSGSGISLRAQLSRPAVLTGIAFLLGALVLIFLPAKKPDAFPGAPATEGALVTGESLKGLPAAMSKAGAGLADSTKSVLSALQTGDAAAPVSAAPTGGLLVSDSITSATLESAQALAATPAAAPSPGDPAVSAVATGIVTFRAKGQSWVEVTDAKGSVVLRRTLAAGELVGATGALPLTAVVGRADATQVQVRGQAFELSAVTKDNVARFEVK
jgi:cytoskeleton protein RodZ